MVATGVTAVADNARVAYFKDRLKSDTLQSELRVVYYDSLISNLPSEMPQLLLKKGSLLRNTGKVREALSVYEQMRGLADSYPLSERLENIYALSNLYLQMGDPLKAMKECTALLTYPKPDSLSYYNVKAFLSLANIYSDIEDDEKLEIVSDKGLNLIESLKGVTPERSYNNLKAAMLTRKGYVMQLKKKWEEAFDLMNEAKRINPEITGRVNVNIGGLFSDQEQHDLAQHYYREALNSKEQDIQGVAAFNMLLEKCKQSQYDEFLSMMEEFKPYLEVWRGTMREGTIYGLLADAYEYFGDYKRAFEMESKMVAITKELMPPEKIREMEREFVKITSAEKDEEIRRVETRNREMAFWIWIAGGLGVAALCVAAWMAWRLRRSGNRLAALRESMAELENDHESALAEKEEFLQIKNREISSMKMMQANLNEHLAALKALAADQKTKKQELVDSILTALQHISSEGDVWDSFMVYFEQTNQGFFDNLYRRHPDLTNAEVRMCAFILLNRTNKEIAAMLHRSVRTVETIKYTLRKKLGISEPTENYLRRLSQN